MVKKLLVVLLAALLISNTGCNKKSDDKVNKDPSNGIYQLQPPKKGDTIAIIFTFQGNIKIKLFPKEAPKAVENFTKLAQSGFYNGVAFHRVIKDFMIQSGDPTGTGRGGQSAFGSAFEDEFSKDLHNFRGALSMANNGPNTNKSQFFIVQAPKLGDQQANDLRQAKDKSPGLGYTDNIISKYLEIGGTPWLDGKHTVFGQVYEGMDIVDQIASVKTGANDKPIEAIPINKIEVSQIP